MAHKRLPTSMFCQDAVDPMRLLEENLTDEEETGGKRCCLCATSCSFMAFCSVLSQDIVDCNPVGASRSWLIDEMFELNSCIAASCQLKYQLKDSAPPCHFSGHMGQIFVEHRLMSHFGSHSIRWIMPLAA